MANRNFNRKQALEKEIKEIYAEIAIGASGAPTLTKGLGVESITRNGAGDYTLTLEDSWVRLMSMHATHEAASAEDITFQISAKDVTTAKTVDFFTKTGATETDPSDGSTLFIRLELKNSSSGA